MWSGMGRSKAIEAWLKNENQTLNLTFSLGLVRSGS